MGIRDWKRMKKHKDYLLSRILQLRHEIFFKALEGEIVCETKSDDMTAIIMFKAFIGKSFLPVKMPNLLIRKYINYQSI